jgi:hypothetical protein
MQGLGITANIGLKYNSRVQERAVMIPRIGPAVQRIRPKELTLW